MSFVVKNTTKCGLLDLVCPHSCRGCGALGAVLCERCKKHIIQRHEFICPYCKRTFPNNDQRQDKDPESASYWNQDLRVCQECASPFLGIWAVGWREGILAKLVSELKYKSVRACSDTLAELLDHAIPAILTPDPKQNIKPIIVPLPTIGKHIRERGLDHTWLIAKKLAKRRGWRVQHLLRRKIDTVQVGTNASNRLKQATRAYELAQKINPNQPYLLLDDVWTTGASMQAAANLLKEAGAQYIYGAIIEVGRSQSTSDEATIDAS